MHCNLIHIFFAPAPYRVCPLPSVCQALSFKILFNSFNDTEVLLSKALEKKLWRSFFSAFLWPSLTHWGGGWGGTVQQTARCTVLEAICDK